MENQRKIAKVEEFVAYDQQGKAVVLRSNRPLSQVDKTKPALLSSQPASKPLFAKSSENRGSMGLLGKFTEVRGRLQANSSQKMSKIA